MSYRNTKFNPNSFLSCENEVLQDRYKRMKEAVSLAIRSLETLQNTELGKETVDLTIGLAVDTLKEAIR